MEYHLQSVQAVTEFYQSRMCQAAASTKLTGKRLIIRSEIIE